MGQMYSVSFSAVAVTAAQDVFEINVASTKAVEIHSIVLGQYTDFGDAASEILSVLFIRGYTSSGSGGSAATPAKLATGYAAAASTAEVNNTTVASGGSPITLHAEAWNIQAPFAYRPTPEERIELAPSERFVVRTTIPADSVTLNGTLYFKEIG